MQKIKDKRKIAAGVCCKIITVIALHHPVSGAGCVLQKPKKTRVFEKTDITKRSLFRR